MQRRGLSAIYLLLLATLAGSGLVGCSAHDVVKPNVDDGTGDAGGSGADGGGDGSDSDEGMPSPDCNLTGIWFTKVVSVTQALSLPQYATAWTYVEIDQPPGSADFTVIKGFECGTEVHGSVTVTLLPVTLEAHMKHNSQVGRKGTMKKDPGGSCSISAEPFWVLLGAAETFLPPRNTDEEIEPVAARLPLPTPDRPEGAEDWDNDGKLGVSWQVSGVIQGTRSTVQRQWTRWFTNDKYVVAPAMDWSEIVVRADFDKDEAVFDPTSGPLVSPSYSVRTPETPNRYVMRFLGRGKNDPRAAAVRGTDPAGDTAATVATCYALQDMLPAEDM